MNPTPGSQITLLELVEALSKQAGREDEIVASVCTLVSRGRVELVGEFVDRHVAGARGTLSDVEPTPRRSAA